MKSGPVRVRFDFRPLFSIRRRQEFEEKFEDVLEPVIAFLEHVVKAFSVKVVIALIRGLVRWTKDVGNHSQMRALSLRKNKAKAGFWAVEISQNAKMVLSFG
jgi:hypothetical protein